MYVCRCVLVYMCMLVCTCMYVHIVHPPLWYMFWGWEQNRPLCWSCPLTALSPLACSVCGMAMGQERMKERKRAMTKYMGQFESIPLPEWKHHHSSWSLWQWAGEKRQSISICNPFIGRSKMSVYNTLICVPKGLYTQLLCANLICFWILSHDLHLYYTRLPMHYTDGGFSVSLFWLRNS